MEPGPTVVATRYWHAVKDGRVRCDLCPRGCRLKEGQRGWCFVRQRRDDAIVMTSYGRASGLSVGPIERVPLLHYLPGTAALSLGTAGCNLGCRHCRTWDLGRAWDTDLTGEAASPERVTAAALALGCRSVVLTENDPVVFHEYALDIADACHDAGLRAVAATAGYVNPRPAAELFGRLDAVNVDLKAFSDAFYRDVCGGRLAPVLKVLRHIRHETAAWLEISVLLIPGRNDADDPIRRLSGWVAETLGPDTPVHFVAFQPGSRMRDSVPTPPAALRRARALAWAEGLRHAYTSDTRDVAGNAVLCRGCGGPVVERDWYRVSSWHLAADGRCEACGAALAGRFEAGFGSWGPQRRSVDLDAVTADGAGAAAAPLPAPLLPALAGAE